MRMVLPTCEREAQMVSQCQVKMHINRLDL